MLQGATGLTLSHLSLQGASFDGTRLTSLAPDSPTNNPTPPVTLAWVAKQTQDAAAMFISVPLYSEPQRRHVIAHLQLPVPDKSTRQDHLLAGLAACLLT